MMNQKTIRACRIIKCLFRMLDWVRKLLIRVVMRDFEQMSGDYDSNFLLMSPVP